MKTFVHVLFAAACLVACAHALPGGSRESFEDDFEDAFIMSSFFNDMVQRFRQNMFKYFWPMNDFPNPPEGANTTSTVKVIDGHMVTINETTYTSGDENGGTAFRIRIIDVKPTDTTSSDSESTTIKAEAPNVESREDFNNEIGKNVDTLTA